MANLNADKPIAVLDVSLLVWMVLLTAQSLTYRLTYSLVWFQISPNPPSLCSMQKPNAAWPLLRLERKLEGMK